MHSCWCAHGYIFKARQHIGAVIERRVAPALAAECGRAESIDEQFSGRVCRQACMETMK